jgi:AraC-like DNA-binding protein
MKPTSTCQTHRESHFGICTTLDVSTANYSEDGEAEHSGFEICFTLEDSFHYRKFRNRTHLLSPGQLMVFNARERHIEECSKSPSIRRLRTVIIAPEFINKIFDDLSLDADELVFDDILVPTSKKMHQLLAAVFQFKETPWASSVIFDCLMTEIVIEMVTKFRNGQSRRIQSRVATGHFPKSIFRAKEIMRESAYSETADLEEIARCAGLSKFHFVREFKKNVGVSPIRYLNQLRVDIAKEKLKSSQASIAHLAMGMGYDDLSTFNKSFRKISGVAPSQYRNAVRRQNSNIFLA